eukprot:1815342-Amphidinium_carterae.1
MVHESEPRVAFRLRHLQLARSHHGLSPLPAAKVFPDPSKCVTNEATIELLRPFSAAQRLPPFGTHRPHL